MYGRRSSSRYFRPVTAFAAAAALATALAGCSGTQPGGDSSGDGSDRPSGHGAAASTTPTAPAADGQTSAPILAPGAPGEEASTIAPEDVPTGDPWNHTDVAFVQMMIPHHAQALEMSRLAREHAASARVKTLAARIEGAQGPEILAMAAWLQAKGMEVPKAAEDPSAYDHGAHGHQEMAGMLTADQMAALAAARGRTFDRLFLEGMIGHHEGALAMAESVVVGGSDAQAIEMANDVIASQSAEIAIMREMLAER